LRPATSLFVKNGLIGLGAFLREAVRAVELLVDWSAHPLFCDPPRIPKDWKFIQIAPGVFSGPQDPEGHPDAFINHSCSPNAELRLLGGFYLYSLKEIAAGEEVTFDYATLYPPAWSMKCRCGSPACRGMIRGTRSPGSRSGRKPPEWAPPAS
jgi:hypothetical protein